MVTFNISRFACLGRQTGRRGNYPSRAPGSGCARQREGGCCNSCSHVRRPGGSCGDPLTRDPELLRRDVARGYFTAEDVATNYGVVVTGEPPAVDPGATERLRRERR